MLKMSQSIDRTLGKSESLGFKRGAGAIWAVATSKKGSPLRRLYNEIEELNRLRNNLDKGISYDVESYRAYKASIHERVSHIQGDTGLLLKELFGCATNGDKPYA
jgi:hypothetical protein